MKKMLLAQLLCYCLAGCGGGASSSGSGPSLTGNWQITFTQTVGGGGSSSGPAVFVQSGSSVGGSVEVLPLGSTSTANCGYSAVVSGSISETTVVLDLEYGTTIGNGEITQPVKLTGDVNSARTSMSGSYTVPVNDCSLGSGTWLATKTS